MTSLIVGTWHSSSGITGRAQAGGLSGVVSERESEPVKVSEGEDGSGVGGELERAGGGVESPVVVGLLESP